MIDLFRHAVSLADILAPATLWFSFAAWREMRKVRRLLAGPPPSLGMAAPPRSN